MGGGIRSVVMKANQRLTVQLAAWLLAGSTLISMLFGFLRDRLLNSAYLPTESAGIAGYPEGIDAYTAAFMVPDFMFFILVSGALSVSFIPVFNQRLVSGNKRSAWELSTSMINFMALITLVTSVLIIIFAEPLTRYIIAPDFNESSTALTISMMRVMAINPFLFAIATVIASMQQAVGRFTFYALAPSIYNICIIIGLVFFTNGINIFGWQIFEGGIMGVALGVVLGSIVQLIVSSIGLMGLGFDYDFKIYWQNKGFKDVRGLLPARSIDQAMDYIVGIVETNLASSMATGTVRLYNQALILHMAPINLIGVAISTAAFPKMTERLSQGRPDLFKSELQTVLRVIIWLAMPAAALIFFTRGYIVHFIKNGGDATIAGLLGALVIAILFRSIYHIASRSFYAQQDTKTPLYISLFTIALNIGLAVWFTKELEMGPYGLAWAQSIVATVEVLILFVIMNRRIPGFFDMKSLKAVGRMALATFIMSIASYIAVIMLPLQQTDQSFFVALPKFVIIVAVSGVVYLFVSKFLRLQEVDPILRQMKRILFARAKS